MFNVSGLNFLTVIGILTEKRHPVPQIKEKHMIKLFLCIDCKCHVTITALICTLARALAVNHEKKAKHNLNSCDDKS